MMRDPRYRSVRSLLRAQEVTRFKELFTATGFPRTVLAEYMSTNNNRMKRLVNDPTELTIEEVGRIAEYFGVEIEVLMLMMINEYKAKKEGIQMGKGKK